MKKEFYILIIAISSGILFPGCTFQQQPSQATPTQTPSPELTVKISNSQLGKILTDGNGMTLYIFTKDDVNKSNCYDACAKNWPPLIAERVTLPEELKGKIWTIERKDGSKQVTYMGKPLYYFFKDKKPGDTFGEGVNGVWFVIKIDQGSRASGDY